MGAAGPPVRERPSVERDLREFAAIPIVLVLFGAGLLILVAASSASSAWLLAAVPTLLTGLLLGWLVFHRGRASGATGRSARRAPGHEAVDSLHRILLVADDVCAPAVLSDQIARRAAGRPTASLVVAPPLGSRLARWTGDQAAYEHAERVLQATLGALAEAGIAGHGHVGSQDPIQAVDEGLREFRAEEVVLVVHADAEANWLERGVVKTARDRYGLPVAQIVVGRRS